MCYNVYDALSKGCDQGHGAAHQKHKRLTAEPPPKTKSPLLCDRAGSRRHRAHGANGKPNAFVRKTDGKEAV